MERTCRSEERRQVRWIGVSNFDVQQLRRAQAIAPVTSHNLGIRSCTAKSRRQDSSLLLGGKYGVIVYSPMASGLLTGAMTRLRAINLPKDDWRRSHPGLYGTQSLAQSGAGRIVGGRSANATTVSRRSSDCLDTAPSGCYRCHRWSA